MTAIPETHRRIVLVRRPPGAPFGSGFRVEEALVAAPEHGKILVEPA